MTAARVTGLTSMAFALMGALQGMSMDAAYAGGYQTTSLSAQSQGRRNAGAAAAANSPATVFFNPAGLAWLPGTQLEVGVNWVGPTIDWSGSAQGPLGGSIEGATRGGAQEDAYLPQAYLSMALTPQWSLGVGANVPYGLSTSYDSDWVGRYHAIDSQLTSYDLQAALAYRVNEQLAIGGGIDIVYASAELTNAIDFGTLLSALSGPLPALGVYPGSPQTDGWSKLKGNDWSAGINLGVMWEPIASTRLGLSYRSKVDLTLDGHQDTGVPPLVSALSGGAIASQRVGAQADVPLPATLRMGVRHAINGDVTLLAGATWTDWSAFERLEVRFDDARANLLEEQGWRDTWRLNAGVEWRASPTLVLRAGYEHDQSPIPQHWRRPRIPDNDMNWIAVGASWTITPRVAVDLAYSHVFIADFGMQPEEATTGWASGGALGGSMFSGDYESDANLVSMGVRIGL